MSRAPQFRPSVIETGLRCPGSTLASGGQNCDLHFAPVFGRLSQPSYHARAAADFDNAASAIDVAAFQAAQPISYWRHARQDT